MRESSEARRRAPRSALIGLIVLPCLALGCAATRLQSTWVKPDLDGVRFHKIVAIALSNNPVRRRAMEANMADRLRRVAPEVEVTQSSTLFNESEIRDENRVRAALERSGFDAEVVMRVTDVQRQNFYVPGRTTVVPQYYRTFWGYYRYWTPIAYRPGYIERDRDVQVETEVFSTNNGDLLYSALSRTFNPNSPADLAHDVTDVVAKNMKEKGVI